MQVIHSKVPMMNQYLLAYSLCLVSSSVWAELNVQETRRTNIQATTPALIQQQDAAVKLTETFPAEVAQMLERNYPQPTVVRTANTNITNSVVAKLETDTNSSTKRILGLNYSQNSKPFIAFAEAGIFGFGGGVGFAPNAYLDFTAGFNKASWKDVEFSSFELVDGTKYKLDIDTDVKSFYTNIRPFAGKFHVSVGLVNQNNKINGDLRPNDDVFGSDEYTFNHATFDADQVGKVNASLHYEKKTMPYIGIGWSPALTQRFGLTTQLGALYAGKPTIELYPENGNLNVQDKDHTTTLGAALEAEKESFKAKLEWFPVAKLGLWFRF